MKLLYALGVLVAAATTGAASADTSISNNTQIIVYAAATSATLYAREDVSSSFGKLMPGAAMRKGRVGTSGLEQVTFDGWSPQGDMGILYEAPGQRVIVAKLNTSGRSIGSVAGTMTDAYGTVWTHVVVRGWVDRSQVTPDLSAIWAAAQSLYASRCSTCHALHNPEEFSADQWPGILTPMAQRAGLSKQEKQLITQYLQFHARSH